VRGATDVRTGDTGLDRLRDELPTTETRSIARWTLPGRVLAIGCLAVTLGGCGTVGTSKRPAPAGDDKGYLTATSPIDAIAFLRPPPEADSVAQRHDDEVAAAALVLRGSPRWTVATADAEFMNKTLAASSFECALGVPLSQDGTPATLRLLSRVRADVMTASHDIKTHYQRPRPFMVNGQPTCSPGDEKLLRGNGAYPSGHAMLGWLWALTLADVAPGHAQALLARGRAYGESRIVCNVHWRSDVIAGRDVADVAATLVRGNAAYPRDVEAARREIRRLSASGARPSRDCAAEAAALGTPLPAQ